jgi:predicted metalloprotease
LRIDQYRAGQPEHAAEFFAELGVAHEDRIGERMLGEESMDRYLIVVHRNPEHLQTGRAVFALPSRQTRHLREARRTPARPKIQQHEPAVVSRELDPPARKIRAFEVRRGCAELGGEAAAPPAERRSTDQRDRSRSDPHEPTVVGYPISTQLVPKSFSM